VELPRRRRGVVGVGVLTDPYQPFEGRLHLTRGCLEILASHGFPVSLQTKSALILRDVDLIKPESFDVGVTITTLDRDLAGKLEPRASPPEARVQIVEEFSSRKVETWIFLGPIIPAANDSRENFEQIVRVAEKTGSMLLYDKLNLRREIIRPLEEFFRREKPELLKDLPRILQPSFSYWRKISETLEKLCRERNVKCQAAFGHFRKER
jgi:DNA repair photolyase